MIATDRRMADFFSPVSPRPLVCPVRLRWTKGQAEGAFWVLGGREMQFELKLATGRRVVWEGADGKEAAERYVDCHREAEVIAWRDYPRHGVFVLGRGARIID